MSPQNITLLCSLFGFKACKIYLVFISNIIIFNSEHGPKRSIPTTAGWVWCVWCSNSCFGEIWDHVGWNKLHIGASQVWQNTKYIIHVFLKYIHFTPMYKEIDSLPCKPVWMDLLMQHTETIQRPQIPFCFIFTVGPMSIYFNTI